jgi:hypothetical protein
MKSFDKVIKIEIAANQIAKMLLANMNPEFKHAEIVVESIIGSANDVALGMIYNSLNGYKEEINFEVGDIVQPKDLSDYGYWDGEKQSREDIKSATIIEIDVYKEDKLKVSYEKPIQDGSIRVEKTWISHRRCSKIAVESIDLRKKKIDMSKALQNLID